MDAMLELTNRQEEADSPTSGWMLAHYYKEAAILVFYGGLESMKTRLTFYPQPAQKMGLMLEPKQVVDVTNEGEERFLTLVSIFIIVKI